jgi:4-cresol dehydrogenase (hydroxylating)
MDGSSVQITLQHTHEVFSDYGFIPYITFNMVNSKSLECVINVSFRRDERKEVARAKACIRQLNARFMRQGFILYRVGTYNMEDVVTEDDRYWHYVKQLKAVFDPNNVIAPGRYGLT